MRNAWRRVLPALLMCGCLTALAGFAPASVAAAGGSPTGAGSGTGTPPVGALPPAATPLAPIIVRVGIGRNLSSAEVGATGAFTVVNAASGATLVTARDGGTVTLELSPAGVRFGGGVYTGPLRLTAAAGGYVTYAGRRYRGYLEVFKNSRGQLSVVNVLDMEEYLPGVVALEMSGDSWPAEAVKAQAVASRTYALALVAQDKYRAEGFDLSADTSSQVYGGLDVETPKAVSATAATYHEVVVDGAGKVITAFFFSASGGMTENDEYVWNGPGHSYLRGVLDYDQLSPNYRWQVTLTADQLQQKLKAYGVDVGTLQSVQPFIPAGAPEVSYRSPATGQYRDYLVSGDRGQARITASHLRDALGLKSRVFTITATGGNPAGGPSRAPNAVVVVQGAAGISSRQVAASYALGAGGKLVALTGGAQVYQPAAGPATYVIDGRGYGHGVGLSQWGARGMATLGMDYKAILTHYYTGTQVVQK